MFSFKRFSEQFKMLLMQNGQRLALNLLIIALIFSSVHLYMFYAHLHVLKLDFRFWGFVVAIITMMTSSIGVFLALLQNESAIVYYMTPATIGEKYTAAWLYSSIFTISIYTAVIFLVHILAINLGNLLTHQSLPYMFPDRKTFSDGFIGMMTLHSFFLLGAVVFKKNPFGKTLLTIVLIYVAFFFIVVGFFAGMVQNGDFTVNQQPLLDFEKLIGNIISGELLTILKYIAYSIPFICWIAAYFRLKTREV